MNSHCNYTPANDKIHALVITFEKDTSAYQSLKCKESLKHVVVPTCQKQDISAHYVKSTH